MLYGIYNKIDASILSCVVRVLNPKNIIDCSPGSGRTTSVILDSLNKREGVSYYMFEKDNNKLHKIKEYCSKYTNIKFHFDSDITISESVKSIVNVDLLFIDCFHDYILSKWMVHNLFPKVRINGVIHIHDIYYNRCGKGWEDTVSKNVTHPDLIDVERIKSFYGDMYEKYKEMEPITIFEPDIIRRFLGMNENKIQFFSTSSMCYTLGINPNIGMDDGMVPPPCSFYIKIEDTVNVEV